MMHTMDSDHSEKRMSASKRVEVMVETLQMTDVQRVVKCSLAMTNIKRDL